MRSNEDGGAPVDTSCRLLKPDLHPQAQDQGVVKMTPGWFDVLDVRTEI
jgi:hypothetical protein